MAIRLDMAHLLRFVEIDAGRQSNLSVSRKFLARGVKFRQ